MLSHYMKKHRFFSTYLTTAISVALLLTLIGLEAVFVLSTGSLLRQIRENVCLSVVLSDETTSADSLRVDRLLSQVPFCAAYSYISKEDALRDHIENLGENPQDFLGYNPISASFEVKLHSAYVVPDSVEMISSVFRAYPFVESVEYQKDMVEQLDFNLRRITLFLLAIALVLLLVSVALLVNTVRLNVYSRRFLIHTMQLVGATPAFIRRPFVRRFVLLGLLASLLAWGCVLLAVWCCSSALGIHLFAFTVNNILLLGGFVVLVGVLLTWLSSTFAVHRYVRMSRNKLYAI